MALPGEAPSAQSTDFIDRLTDLLFRPEPDPAVANGKPELYYARLNDNSLGYSSYTKAALRPLVQRADVIGWETSHGLFVPRRQFRRFGLTLYPAIKNLWDVWAPSTHSKIADSRTPRTAIFWAALSLTELSSEQLPDGSRSLLDYIEACESATVNGHSAPHCNIPPTIQESFHDVSHISATIAALVMRGEVQPLRLESLASE